MKDDSSKFGWNWTTKEKFSTFSNFKLIPFNEYLGSKEIKIKDIISFDKIKSIVISEFYKSEGYNGWWNFEAIKSINITDKDINK